MTDITMPRLSDTMEEGTIAVWHKQAGDKVAVGDVLCEIETDKATMEYEAYEAGTLAEIVAPAGEVITIGAVIARLDNGAGASAAPKVAVAPVTETVAAPVAVETVVEVAPAAEEIAFSGHAEGNNEWRTASPLVRRLAREHDIDLSTVKGTGPGGRIIRADLDVQINHASEAPKGAAMPLANGPALDDKRGSKEIPFTNVRRVIARRLGESARSIPHFYVTAVADVEALLTLRAQLNEQLAQTGRNKVSVNDMLIRACALALREHPLVNASYVSDTSATMLVHDRVNIGVAVASNNGLVVPVVTDADLKSVSQLGAEAKALVTQAGTKGLSIDQMSGGTFTISNLGMFGVEDFTAIINPPEGAILAVGAAVREPVAVGDEVQLHHRMRYTLSADHRIIDGALAAQFLQTLTRLIENPLSLIV